jgi:glycosyltransferase involved in cell wall biosynthesis
MTYRLAILHSFDPRGTKVGGLETFIRDLIGFKPDDFTFLMIGVDAIGDLPLGKITQIPFRGKMIDFLPIVHYSDAKAKEAALKITDSINYQFFKGLLRHIRAVNAALKTELTSVDLQRVEYSLITSMLRVPFVQMLHGEGAPKLQMDSLLKSYRGVHNAAEWYAMATTDRFLCVNPFISERMRGTYPRHKEKIDTLSTWVDTKTFAAKPFPNDGTFRIAFAGRLDLFKVPSLMFKTVHRLNEKLGGGVEFHYMGTSDPERFPEFDRIRKLSTLHGFKTAAGVADVLANVHAGILTSEFEGMPFSVLESLSAGRPVVAAHLPQLEAVIKDDVSGKLIQRLNSIDADADAISDGFVRIHALIKSGKITPEQVHAQILDFTPERQIGKAYENHRRIQDGRRGRPIKTQSTANAISAQR